MSKELETWLKETKEKNLSENELFDYVYGTLKYEEKIFIQLKGNSAKDKASILFNQWQKEEKQL